MATARISGPGARWGEGDILSPMRANLAGEVRAAIAAAPCTLRALARAAGLSHNTLARLRRGNLIATPSAALKLAEALEEWGATCQQAAKRLRMAARVLTSRRRGKR